MRQVCNPPTESLEPAFTSLQPQVPIWGVGTAVHVPERHNCRLWAIRGTAGDVVREIGHTYLVTRSHVGTWHGSLVWQLSEMSSSWMQPRSASQLSNVQGFPSSQFAGSSHAPSVLALPHYTDALACNPVGRDNQATPIRRVADGDLARFLGTRAVRSALPVHASDCFIAAISVQGFWSSQSSSTPSQTPALHRPPMNKASCSRCHPPTRLRCSFPLPRRRSSCGRHQKEGSSTRCRQAAWRWSHPRPGPSSSPERFRRTSGQRRQELFFVRPPLVRQLPRYQTGSRREARTQCACSPGRDC